MENRAKIWAVLEPIAQQFGGGSFTASDLGKGTLLLQNLPAWAYLDSDPFSNLLLSSSDFPAIKWRLFSSPMF